MSNYTQQKFRCWDRVEADFGVDPLVLPGWGNCQYFARGIDAANTHNVLYIYYYGKNTAHKTQKETNKALCEKKIFKKSI